MGQWLDLACGFRFASHDEMRRKLLSGAESWAAAPKVALEFLDQMHAHSRALVTQLGQAFESIVRTRRRTPAEQAAVRQALAQFLPTAYWPNYAAHRGRLMSFLLRECLSADELLELAPADSPLLDDEHSSLLEHFAADAPLRCLLTAHQALWSV
jgi:hypothetical protein